MDAEATDSLKRTDAPLEFGVAADRSLVRWTDGIHTERFAAVMVGFAVVIAAAVATRAAVGFAVAVAAVAAVVAVAAVAAAAAEAVQCLIAALNQHFDTTHWISRILPSETIERDLWAPVPRRCVQCRLRSKWPVEASFVWAQMQCRVRRLLILQGESALPIASGCFSALV